MKNIALQFDDELMEALNKYRILMGWTWKRMFLYGIAATIDKNSKNDEIMLLIAATLEKRR